MKPGLTLSAGVRYDIEVFPYDRTRAIRSSRAHRGRTRSTRTTSLRVSVWCGIPTAQSKSVIRMGYGLFLRQDAAGNRRQLPDRPEVREVVRGELPAGGRRHRSAQRPLPDRSDAEYDRCEQAHARGARLHQLRLSSWNHGAEHGGGHMGHARPKAAVFPSDQRRIRARAVRGRLGICRLHPHGRAETCSSIRT